MDSNVQLPKSAEPLHVLLIGNNPIDMSRVLDKLNQIRSTKVITEIAFDLRSIMERLLHFHPNYILIDDNIGKYELTNAVTALAEKSKTKNIPITVLKNSNYQEAYAGNTILNYLLKANLSAEALYTAFRNSLKFRRTQLYLYKAYNKRRNASRKLYNA
jgi:hypothetical protein